MRPIWGHDEGGRYRLFRRRMRLDGPGELRLFAEGFYHVWLDGEHLGRGPVPHHPDELPIDVYPLAEGEHLVAVLVYVPGLATLNYIPTGRPGLWAEVTAAGSPAAGSPAAGSPAAGEWKTTTRTGYRSHVPRRTLLLGHVEHLVLTEHPIGWQQPAFDDNAWPTAILVEPPTYLKPPMPRPVPTLRHDVVTAKHIDTFALAKPPEPLSPGPGTIDRQGIAGTAAYGTALMNAGWTRTDHAAGDVALVYDLGGEYVGEPLLELTSDGPGIIDFGFAELLDDEGRPALMMKGGSYANRVETPGGRMSFEGLAYSGMRYLAVMLRGFDTLPTMHQVGVRASTPALRLRPPPPSGDADLDRVLELCTRTIRVGVQEILADCPTREQAMYLGDGHHIARWLARLTGDTSHWRRLVRGQFARPADNGLIRSVVFSAGPVMLLDYNLLGIIGTRDYHAADDDVATVADVLPTARGVYAWFARQLAADGILRDDLSQFERGSQREERYDPTLPNGEVHRNLFIDHPGMGWHNIGEPGIDRRGTNAAINALLSITERALADLEDAVGSPADAMKLRARANARRDPARSLFFDGKHFRDGAGSPQISQQTHVWATLAGWSDPVEAATYLEPLFATPPPDAAVCGPYFWTFAIAALRYANLEALARQRVIDLWTPMLDAGATTTWETFNGDAYDSRCHPWSCAPLDLV
jgi:hypothetical protein